MKKKVDYHQAKQLREKYLRANSSSLPPTNQTPQTQEQDHGSATVLVGSYDGKRIDKEKKQTKLNAIPPQSSLVFLMGYGKTMRDTCLTNHDFLKITP